MLFYCKKFRYWDNLDNYCNHPKNGIVWFYNAVICPKDAGGRASSVDPDQIAPK